MGADAELTEHDLTAEEWREYDFDDGGRVYRVNGPVKLFTRKGGKTHRVLDTAGVVHCIPAPGVDGCVLRWKPKNAAKPVQF